MTHTRKEEQDDRESTSLVLEGLTARTKDIRAESGGCSYYTPL